MIENKVGLANPYALAEIALGRRVRWDAVKDRDAFVAKTLGASVDELVAPKKGNLLVAGVADVQRVLADARQTRSLKALGDRLEGAPIARMLDRLAPAARTRVLAALSGGVSSDGMRYTLDGAEWADPGEFFEEAAEYYDPVQGGLGDCYFIAALSAVAWSRPYVIVQRTRAIGHDNEAFVDRIDFYANGVAEKIEVTEVVPLIQSTHGWIYARSSETGEIWPAVYEKAFAKWKTKTSSDQPDYAPIAGGWPVEATCELTNLTGTTQTCADFSASQIWDMVRSNSYGPRTVNPMTAWTFCTDTPPVDYAGTGIYAYHAYTILGWAYVNRQKYVVIRNPWGQNGPVIDALPGTWFAYDQSFWRSTPLNSGGIFALPIDTFKKYYWQLGWATGVA